MPPVPELPDEPSSLELSPVEPPSVEPPSVEPPSVEPLLPLIVPPPVEEPSAIDVEPPVVSDAVIVAVVLPSPVVEEVSEAGELSSPAHAPTIKHKIPNPSFLSTAAL